MLAKKYKLTRKDNIEDILAKGEELKSRYFVIKYEKGTEEFNRFSLVVSAKLSKKAVTRNRLRRQLFEIIRLNSDEIPAAHNIVILPKMIALKLDHEELEKNILEILSKIK